MVDENPAHHAPGDREEVCPVVQLDAGLIDETEVHLVGESGGLKGVVGTFAPEVAARQASELLVDLRHELIEGGTIAAPRSQEEPGRVVRSVSGHGASLGRLELAGEPDRVGPTPFISQAPSIFGSFRKR
jgi:hypothetical protein